MNIILFGPPGVGKSTLIGAAKTAGARAIDLEDVYPSKIRFQLPNMVDGCIFGGADLSPQRKYPNCLKVLCYLPENQYQLRRLRRDKMQPEKAQQSQQTMAEWHKATHWDLLLPVNRPAKELVFDVLLPRITGTTQHPLVTPDTEQSENGGS